MAFVSVFSSLGESGLLGVFNQLLEKTLIDGFVSTSKAARMLAAHLETGSASRIINELYGDADIKQSTLIKLFCRLFADDLEQLQLDLLNKKLAALQEGSNSAFCLIRRLSGLERFNGCRDDVFLNTAPGSPVTNKFA